MNLKIISAGAGSGKTYRLTLEMAKLLMPQADGKPAAVRASGILATTFTNKAAAELKERVRVRLLEEGLSQEADELGNAMIGTVHSIGVQLLKRFAFEAGVSPDVDIIAEEDHQTIFNQSLSTILTEERVQAMEQLSELLGFRKNLMYAKDWRRDLSIITDIARANNMSLEVLERSKAYSIDGFIGLLPPVSNKSAEAFLERLKYLLEQTIVDVEETQDGTKAKETLQGSLRKVNKDLRLRGKLYWHEWLGIAKACEKAPKKCREAVEDLREFALTHDTHPDFHEDLQRYISLSFDLAMEALKEYEAYKKSRGLIDYTDMEVMILKLLENPMVTEVLADELDLLLVDEFQDTNPIQLKIFLQLSELAKQSIWVGDPKQSIYGFRGAAPELMKAVMDSAAENTEVLEYSWRSRSDLVNMVNGLFVEAFNTMPSDRVALQVPEHFQKSKEDPLLSQALRHWVINYTEGNKVPGKPWLEKAIAKATAELLEQGLYVRDKNGDGGVRPLQAGDIAILCRSNSACQEIAAQLHTQGLKASISRSGLLETPEACLIHACLKFILNEQDSLSIAEIMLLMEKLPIEKIVEKRLEFIEEHREAAKYKLWGEEHDPIKELTDLRYEVQEMSATEIMNLLLEKLDIRRVAAAWGDAQQRFDNIDALRAMALQYEENCNRLHNAATLGGFLLWLDELSRNNRDEQGSGVDRHAVNVLTYHKSKGLEWPVVICFDLANNLRENVFDVRIVSETAEIDLKDPLAGRLLCFWVNPYGDLVNNTALMTAIDIHPDRQKIKQAALDEEARLMYVGLTRARDYLILPVVPQHRSNNYGTDWLNRVFHHGQKEIPSIDPLSPVCLWSWEGYEIPVVTNVWEFAKEIEGIGEKAAEEIEYLEKYSGEKPHSSEHPESPDDLFQQLQVATKSPLEYCKPLLLPEDEEIDLPDLNKVLHLFLRSDRPSYSLSLRESSANHLLHQFRMEGWLNSINLLNISNRFHKQLKSLFLDFVLQNGVLFKYKQENRFFKGSLDYLLTRPDGERILINDVPLALEEFKKRAKKKEEFGAFLYAAAQALQAQNPMDGGFQYWLHFPLEGRLLAISVK